MSLCIHIMKYKPMYMKSQKCEYIIHDAKRKKKLQNKNTLLNLIIMNKMQ